MKAIYPTLCTALVLAILAVVAFIMRLQTRTVAEEEAFSRAKLERDSEEMKSRINKCQILNWKHETNLTDENLKKYKHVELQVDEFYEVSLHF